MNCQSSRYRLEIAEEQDSSKLLDILESSSFKGAMELMYTRRPNAYESLQREGEKVIVIKTIDNKTNKICAMATCAVRTLFINGKTVKAGYLLTLKALPQYIGKINILPMGYKIIHEHLQLKYYYTTILSENTYAIKLLEKQRKNMPYYHYSGEYTVSIIKTNLPRIVSCEFTLEQGKDSFKQEIFQFINSCQNNLQLGVYLDEEILNSYINIDISNFFIVRDKLMQIRGICAAWDQRDYKQYIATAYNGILKYLPKYSKICNFFGYPKLPMVNDTVNFYTLSLLSIKDDNFDVFNFLLSEVSRIKNSYDFFIVGFHESQKLQKSLKHLKKVEYKSRLYFVDYEKNSRYEGHFEKKYPVSMECALL